MFKKASVLLALAIALVFTAQAAFAELSDVGPVNPQNGFPVWYQDSNGVAVELGLDPALNLFDPPIAGNDFSEQIGFGAEGFYWIAETFVDFPGGQLFYRANLEYAWVNELPADGDQFVFTRLRFRANVPAPGEYEIIHPYGVDTFTVDQETFDLTAGVRAINVTLDVGGATPDFRTALTGRVGPFLTAVNPPPPAGFLGSGAAITTATVTGSPFGTNFVRIKGPGIDAQTDQFMVAAKIFTGQVNTPLTVERATYERGAHTGVDVMASSTPGATVAVEGLTASPAPMTGDGTGKFYRHIHVAGDLPATITVRADDNPLDPIVVATGIIKNLVDHVHITSAEYDVALRTLTIQAESGETVTPLVLTATGFGDLTAGSLAVANVLVPPASVTVTSSAGGSDTANVHIVAHDVLPNAAPAAANDTLTAITEVATSINVTANDTDVDGTVNLLSVAIVDSPLNGAALNNGDGTITYTSNLGFTGTDTLTYTVQDDLGATSNVGTLTITVIPTPPPNTAPVAVNDLVNTAFNTAVVINVIANDTDADGNLTINPASVAIVAAPLNGTVLSNGDGTVTYTPTAGVSGADSFTYTIRDNANALSNAATVNVTVAAAPTETVTVTTSLFRIIGARWIVSGTGSMPGSVITIRIEGGAQLGTATVSPLGIWSLALRNSLIIPAPGATLRVTSSGGADLRNVAVTIRN